MTFTIQNGTLTLTKTDPGLEPLALFFDVLIERETFVITNAQPGEVANNQVTITGQTTALGDTAQVELTHYADSGALALLKVVQPLTEFDGLALPGLTFSKLEHHLHLIAPAAGSTELVRLWRELKGEFHIGQSVTIPFKIANPVASQTLLIETAFEPDSAPGLTDLAHLFGTTDNPAQDLDWLPEELRKPELITLRDLQFKLDPKESHILSMVSVTIDLVPGHMWPIIPGSTFLSIGNLWLTIEVDYPLEADYRFPVVEFGGSIKIGEATNDGLINLVARWPDFAISGRLAEGQQIRIGQLLRELNLALADLPEGNHELVIDKLSFSAEPTTTPRRYTFSIDIANLWSFPLPGDTNLLIAELSFFLDYTGPSANTNSITAVTLLGKLNIAGVDLTMTANHAGPDNGWDFAGSTGSGQQIHIGTLIDDLAGKFGAITLPTEISHLIIENLRLNFNTRSKDFTFSGETQFPIGTDTQKTLDAIITIEIRHQADGSFTKRFSGHLTVAELVFDLIFESERQANTTADSQLFLAAYRNPRGHPINIDELIKEVEINDVTTGLSITIKEALVAYTAQVDAAGAKTSRWLFGINIEGGLNLSVLKLADLPLLSATLPPNQSLVLDFQVLVPSNPFIQAEIQVLNGLVNDGTIGLPAKDIKNLDLAVALKMGAESRQLDLPLGIQSPPTGSTNQTGIVANPNATPAPGAGGDVTSPDGVRWVSIQKTLGPLRFERVGLKYDSQSKTIQGWLDAALTAGGLTIALNGLSVSSPLDGFNPTFSLQGLGIDYGNGPLEIGGTFLKRDNGFAGLAVIRTKVLTLSAIGAYSSVEGQPSLFIYAILNYPLGGPAFFYVTGLAAGFGYNRQLIVPTIDQIAAFPLVAEAVKGDLPPMPADQQNQQQTLTNEINKLAQYIPPAVGQNFLAVGLKFTTFKQVNSFALLIVQFGSRFEIDLLGLSTLLAPTPDEGGQVVSPVAEAQMALKATFSPDEGFLGIRAQLTANSYILSRACQLTGGFAFYSWFSGPYGGDFVITLGGYHPAFKVPAHYPQVPRLGFAWQVNPQFYLKGGLYFALTGHALMAGGNLDALFQSDNIRAWFKAGADFLISWKPYHYDISVFVDMGIEVTFDFFGTQHISLAAGAMLHLWGPEFAGQAHIEVKVLFFTIPINISFGSSSQLAQAITWADFRQSFLPAQNDQVCSIAVQAGLVRTIQQKDTNGQAEEWWVVNAKEMVLVTNSVIPSTQAGGVAAASPLNQAHTKLAVQPMGVGVGDLSTTHTITITGLAQEGGKPLSFNPILKSVPTALWGPPQVKEINGTRYIEKPDLNGDTLVRETLAGFEIRVGQAVTAGATHPIERYVLQAATPELAPGETAWLELETTDVWGEAAWAAARDTVVQNARRDALLAVLGLQQSEIDFGEPVDQDIVLVSA